ncbi:hypothetical protein ASL14_04305 [Paenibacillus sp. IHB B 3084]|uniref:hypothetical protein n=1 Tax=Paenibacillus sp. IHB B 3084 TaxID=867076 RepID=UPI00071EBEEB|nr:hypothetical protein [Paenibacillus sp. IHB B 3084]ALP35509.1 hypothetical protein ASL14_04305 [Paenibacillus sp. IHB B 3084]
MNQTELEERISKLILIVLPQMRVKGIVLQEEFNELLNCMEQLSYLTIDKDIISKKLAFNLFYFYTQTTMEFELYIKDKEAQGDFLVRLYIQTMNVLSGLHLDR